jgi:squalene-hopene/tetraprenyl-beta-curcumene cyclase
LPYALARPALRASLNERDVSPNERKLLDSVTKRVRQWNETKPFYGDSDGANKAVQSRGTESVLNALILASVDARNGTLSEGTQAAFQNMWALQETVGADKGAWPWLDFGNEPFEGKDSRFYGASLAAVAVGTAPQGFRATPEIRGKVSLLKQYLEREYVSQSLINQAVLLWSSARLPGLLSSKQQSSIVNELLSKQQADGGWVLSSLAWTWKGASLKSAIKLWARSEDTPLEAKSDGYATGLIAFALEQYGMPRANIQLQRALDWLAHNQNQADGRWPGYSLNHGHDSSPLGLFMSDAATAFAVLALTGSQTP